MKGSKLSVIEFNPSTSEYLGEKVAIPALPDTPLTIAFLGSLIYFGTKKEYGMIDLNKKLTPVLMPMSISPFPFIKVTDNDELFILATNSNTGLLIGVRFIPPAAVSEECLGISVTATLDRELRLSR